MRKIAMILSALLVLTAMGSMVSAEVGWDNPLAVFIVLPDVEFDVGTVLDIPVHVFREGEYSDPDEINFTVGWDGREINLTREDTGLYMATFTVQEEDVDWGGDIYLFVTVADSGGILYEMAEDYAFMISSSGSPDLFMLMCEIADPMDENAAPGQVIEVDIRTTWDGDPVDPDSGTLEVSVMDPDYNDLTYELNRVETGYYRVTFTVPSGMETSGSIEVGVSAEYSTGGDTFDDYDWVDVYVRLVQVWVHWVDVSDTRTEVEYYVLDAEGVPVEGADVDVTYEYWNDDWDDVSKDLSGTTDEDGMVSFVLTYNDLGEEEYYIHVMVLVDADGIETEFEENILVREEPPYVQYGFNVELPSEFLDADADVTLDLVATYDGVPMPLQEIVMYVVGDYDLVFYGTDRTDTSGHFELAFHTPSVPPGEDINYIEVYFQTQHLMIWEATSTYMYIGEFPGGSEDIRDYLDAGTSLTVSSFRAGESAEVTLTCTAADGVDETSMVMWFAGSVDNLMETYHTEWSTVGSWGTDPILGQAMATWSDGAYHATIPIPVIMSPDTSLTFVGMVAFPDPWSGNIKAAVKEGVHALPPNVPPDVAITFPVAGGQYSGDLTIEGTSSDDKSVDKVEYRIDGGAWNQVEGTTDWSLEIDTTALSSTTHQLDVRAWDGEEWSLVKSVVFEVDQPPEVTMETPITGTLDGIVTFIGNALDDNDVDKVEYQVDDGGWFSATGTTDWSFEIDTSMFTSDDHVLKLRASDGERFSLELEFDFSINQLPLISITGHVEGKVYKDKVTFTGTASDDIAVVKVEVRIDAGDWIDLGAITAWTYKPAVDKMKEGNHTLEVRVYDGEKYSGVETTYFTFEKSEEPGFGLMVALLAVMAAVPVARWRMRASG